MSLLNNQIKLFIANRAGSVAFEAIWVALFLAFFIAPTAYLYQVSRVGLEVSTISRVAARNEAVNNSCTRSGKFPLPADIGKSDVSISLLNCDSNIDGETPLEADNHFWKKMTDLSDQHFTDFSKSFADHAQHRAVLGKQNTLFTEVFDLGQGGGFFNLGLHIPVRLNTQTLAPGTDYWQFDKDYWAQGHDKIICAELTAAQVEMLPTVYPSGCAPDGNVPPEPTGQPPVTTTGPGPEGPDEPDTGEPDTTGTGEPTPEGEGTEAGEDANSLLDDCLDNVTGHIIGVANDYEQPDDDPRLNQTETTYGDQLPDTATDGPSVTSEVGCELLDESGSLVEGGDTWTGENGEISLDVGLGNYELEADLNAVIDWTEGTGAVNATAGGNVSVGEIATEGSFEAFEGVLTGDGSATLEVVQAGLEGDLELAVDLNNGTVVASGEVSIEANLIKVEGDISGTVTVAGVPITLTAEGGASIGAGASASGTFAVTSEGITIGGKLGAALGLGLEGGVSITIGWPSWW